jgi:hypothetical protein
MKGRDLCRNASSAARLHIDGPLFLSVVKETANPG